MCSILRKISPEAQLPLSDCSGESHMAKQMGRVDGSLGCKYMYRSLPTSQSMEEASACQPPSSCHAVPSFGEPLFPDPEQLPSVTPWV